MDAAAVSPSTSTKDAAVMPPSTSTKVPFAGVSHTVRQSIVRSQDDLDSDTFLPSANDLSSAEFSQCSGEFMLHPEGSFHCTFDSIVVLSCAVSLVTIPFVMSVLMNDHLPRFYVIVDLALESVLLVDIISAFFTSFYDEKAFSSGISMLVHNRHRVRMRYLSTTFMRDVALSLPVDTVCDLAGAGHSVLLYLRLYRFLARAVRLRYVLCEGRYLLPRTFLKFEVSFRALDGQFTFIKFLSGVLYIFHVATCCTIAFEVEVEDIRYQDYVAAKRYVDAFFRTELLMIGVGRQKTEDMDGPWGLFFLCFFVLVGSAMLGFLFAQVAEVLNRLNLEKREHLVYTTKLQRAMRSMGIDKHLQNKLHLWSEQQWYMYTRSGEAFVEQIFESDMLNSSLKHELALQVRSEIVAQFHCLVMLQEISHVSVYAKVLLSDFCQLLKQRIYLPGDFLCRRKTHAVKAHILLTGQCCSDTVVDQGGGLVVTQSCNTASNRCSKFSSASSISPMSDGLTKTDRCMQNSWMHTVRLPAPRFFNAQTLLYKGTTYYASFVATSNCEVYEISADAYCKCVENYNVTEEARCVLEAFENELFQTLSLLELENLQKPAEEKVNPDPRCPSPSPTLPGTWAPAAPNTGGLEGLPEHGVFDADDCISDAGVVSGTLMQSPSMVSTRTNPEMQKLRRQQAYVSKMNTASNIMPLNVTDNNGRNGRRFSSVSHLWSRRSATSLSASLSLGQISPCSSRNSSMVGAIPTFSFASHPNLPVITKSTALSTPAYLNLNPALNATDPDKNPNRSKSTSPATSTTNVPDIQIFPRADSPEEDPFSQPVVRDYCHCCALNAPEFCPDAHSIPKTAFTDADNSRSPASTQQQTTGDTLCYKAPTGEEEDIDPPSPGGNSSSPPPLRLLRQLNDAPLAPAQKDNNVPHLMSAGVVEMRFPRLRVLHRDPHETEADPQTMQLLLEAVNKKLDLLLGDEQKKRFATSALRI